MRRLLVTVFLTMLGVSMTQTVADLPEAQKDILRYTEIIQQDFHQDIDILVSKLMELGLTEQKANEVVWFTSIAFGRTLLNGSGIEFSDVYLVFNSRGKVIQEGLLSENETYQAAEVVALALYANQDLFLNIALISSEINSVNQALESGITMEDLRGSKLFPVGVFSETISDHNLQRAFEVIQSYGVD